MEKVATIGRIFYCVAMGGIGIHQLFYGDFCNFLFPAWPNPIPGYSITAYIFSLALIGASGAIMLGKQARVLSLLLGAVLLLMLFFGQVPFEYIVIPHKKTHLGLWILPLKELALAGGAFCMAGQFPPQQLGVAGKSHIVNVLEKLIPLGRFFFCTTMISFGISHFVYPETVSSMVPEWVPSHYFWTYFSGVALIAGGVAIVLNIWLKPAAMAMGMMILVWFIALHIPDAISNPLEQNGNEITAAFSALAFSGIAFMIATRKHVQQ